MNRHYAVPLFFLALALGMIAGMAVERAANNAMTPFSADREGRLSELMHLIESEYLTHVDSDSLLDEVLGDLVSRLDPHSVFWSKDRIESDQWAEERSFNGIGIVFRMHRDTAVVLDFLEGGSAKETEIRRGDRIVRIDDSLVSGPGVDESTLMDALSGEEGKPVNLELQRRGAKRPIWIAVWRTRIEQPSVSTFIMIEPSVAYVRIEWFDEETHQELRMALEQLLHKGMKSLVLDLRGNKGGLMSAAEGVADEFLGDDVLIYTSENREGVRRTHEATGYGFFEVGDMVVLIDQGSASASEAVAAALQEHDRARLVGRRSFGKGIAQGEIRLQGGAVVRLTQLKLFTPSGKSIQRPYEEDEDTYLHRAEEDRFAIDKDAQGGLQPDYFVSDTLSDSEKEVYRRVPIDSLADAALVFWEANRNQLAAEGPGRWMTSELDRLGVFRKVPWRWWARLNSETDRQTLWSLFRFEVFDVAFAESERRPWVFDADPDVQKALELLKNKTP
ncbi:PDZ domain-containing protein [bacterium]|nr:PDZ domain-containing protein [bacterium]